MRSKIVEEARTYLGDRWRHQGRTHDGIDCAGLIIVVGNKLKLIDYEAGNYPRRTSGGMFCDYFAEAGLITKSIPRAEPGDILLTKDSDLPCHCGFVTMKRGKLHFLHATAARRKVVEEPLEHWLPKATHLFEFPGLEG